MLYHPESSSQRDSTSLAFLCRQTKRFLALLLMIRPTWLNFWHVTNQDTWKWRPFVARVVIQLPPILAPRLACKMSV